MFYVHFYAKWHCAAALLNRSHGIYPDLSDYWITKIIFVNYIMFMAHRAIPMIAFPRVRTIYIYILVSLTRVCVVYVVYVVKEVTSSPGGSIN